jgi:myosin protein heavy chain
MFRSKVESLEQETRHTKEQLSELTRTATDYSSMLARKEESIDRLEASLEASQVEKSRSVQEVISLRAEIDTLAGELEAQKTDRARGLAARQKLQAELDELRTLLAAKHSDDARRSEVEKSMEVELNDLRRQTSRLQEEASDARRQALEGQTRLKAAQDSASRELSTLQQAHRALADKERDASTRLSAIETEFTEVDKVRRSMETELLSVRSRQMDLDGQLSETLRAKDVSITVSFASSLSHTSIRSSRSRSLRLKLGIATSRMRS